MQRDQLFELSQDCWEGCTRARCNDSTGRCSLKSFAAGESGFVPFLQKKISNFFFVFKPICLSSSVSVPLLQCRFVILLNGVPEL